MQLKDWLPVSFLQEFIHPGKYLVCAFNIDEAELSLRYEDRYVLHKNVFCRE
jgi:hypothetical protein